MNTLTPEVATQFVNTLELPPADLKADLVGATPIDFDQHKNQTLIVASDVLSFVKGVSVERRKDIVNASLLAQLAATKKVPSKENFPEWYDAYFDVLEHIGWVIHDKGFSSYEHEADDLETDEAILQVAQGFFVPGSTAITMITSALKALKKSKDEPWITLWERESKEAEGARFQVSLAEQEEDGQFLITLMAFKLKATSKITRILVFKIREDGVKLEKWDGKITINEDVVASIRDKVKEKIAVYIDKYLAALPV